MDYTSFPSVSDLNLYVKNCLETNPPLQNLCVCGEISNYKLYPSGHQYFSLKDSESAVSCVMFRTSSSSLRFRPENGLNVLICGRASIYPRDGKYQIIVSTMMPAGAGNLQLAFEQLKDKLEKKGLFDDSLKKPLPEYPERIALITSPAGAAVRDMIRILGSRWPMSQVLVVPVRVQGSDAPAEIASAIEYVNHFCLADVIITGRGGGSAEDLWAFNDERVAYAVFASDIPVISAVGHEPDVSIVDYVADRRASTPSNGAELCVPDQREIADILISLRQRLISAAERSLSDRQTKFENLESARVLQNPMEIVSLRRMDLDLFLERMDHSFDLIIDRNKSSLGMLITALDALSPLKVLTRGYALALKENGMPVRSCAELLSEKRFRLRLNDGLVSCTADELE